MGPCWVLKAYGVHQKQKGMMRRTACGCETVWGAPASPLGFLRVKWDTRKGGGREMRLERWVGNLGQV